MTDVKQQDRISYSMSYKGIIVDDSNSYHPEKMDILVTKTLDIIEGETLEETKERISKMKPIEELLLNDVGATVSSKVQAIKDRFQ